MVRLFYLFFFLGRDTTRLFFCSCYILFKSHFYSPEDHYSCILLMDLFDNSKAKLSSLYFSPTVYYLFIGYRRYKIRSVIKDLVTVIGFSCSSMTGRQQDRTHEATELRNGGLEIGGVIVLLLTHQLLVLGLGRASSVSSFLSLTCRPSIRIVLLVFKIRNVPTLSRNVDSVTLR